MKKLLLLLGKIYLLLLFVVFQAVAISFYANSTLFTRARLVGLSNLLVGRGHSVVSGVTGFFSLGRDNRLLTAEIAKLRQELGILRAAADTATIELPHGDFSYVFTSARVINNSVNRQRNFITIDKGSRDGIRPDMALTTPEGYVIGYVIDCSDRFSSCISLLNIDFHSSGILSDGDAYGPISWNGRSTEYVTLSDIPKYAEINRGDTVLTTGFSAIFPPGMMIGTVESHRMTESMLYDVRVRIAAHMASLNHVLVIDNLDSDERHELEGRAGGQNDMERTH